MLILESPTTLTALAYLSLDNVRIRPDTLWQLLCPSTNIKALCLVDIICMSDIAWRPPQTARLHLPRLTHLEISCYYDSEPAIIAQWASCLDLPRLESVDLTDVSSPDLLALAPCFRDSLRKLSYEHEHEPQGLAHVFAAFPHVRELSFSSRTHFLPELALLQAMADGTVFPELERLLFWGVDLIWNPEPAEEVDEYMDGDEARATAEALMDFVRSRNSLEHRDAALAQERRPPPRLELIQFNEGKIDDQFFCDLKELVAVHF
ncbi:hypothetical protein AURDEDRAFT_174312 [Auricularia subglabra TFB-10046 SS5]|nr:hypothetical protein AURDEDRAFT_174312 [Auricularia subglabra TFB-10046 SS5]